MTQPIALVVNGQRRELQVEPRRLLVQVIREELDLTGTHVGCDTSQCGACTVHVDGRAIKSCTMLAVQADGCTVRTIEDMQDGDTLHPLQAAFWEKHELQCGFCTPGMIMTAVDFLERTTDPSDEEIRHAIEGNYCRCTGYQNIVAAIKEASSLLRAGGTASIAVGGDDEEPLPPFSQEEGAAPAGPVAEAQETSPSGSSSSSS